MAIDTDAHGPHKVPGHNHQVLAAGGGLQLVCVEAGPQGLVGHVQVSVSLQAAHEEDDPPVVVEAQVAVVPGADVALNHVEQRELLGQAILVCGRQEAPGLGQEQQN